MNRAELYRIIYTATSCNVFPDYVPKEEELPAVSYKHITDFRAKRQVNGSSTGKADSWRLTIAGENRDQCDTIASEISLLDGLPSDMFQAVNILNASDEPADNNTIVFRCFIDIKTFDK